MNASLPALTQHLPLPPASDTSSDDPVILSQKTSTDGTIKLLLQLSDGQTIETVSIPMPASRTVCLSTQVGCPIGCLFCRTGQTGFRRNLTENELTAQLRIISNETHRLTGTWPERAVFMGMGEPLLNFTVLRHCLEIMSNPDVRHISWRKILVSTVGIPENLDILGRTRMALPAISLHAPNQKLRDWLMPGARNWPLTELIPALQRYPLPGRERMLIEYVMLDGLNDTDTHADELHDVLGALRAKINLIPCNPTPEGTFRASSPERQESFLRRLKEHGRTTFVRRRHGPDIMAACGQLRDRHLTDGTGDAPQEAVS